MRDLRSYIIRFVAAEPGGAALLDINDIHGPTILIYNKFPNANQTGGNVVDIPILNPLSNVNNQFMVNGRKDQPLVLRNIVKRNMCYKSFDSNMRNIMDMHKREDELVEIELGETYYVAAGLILDENFSPLLISTTRVLTDPSDQTHRTVIGQKVYISPDVYSKSTKMAKFIINKIIPMVSSSGMEVTITPIRGMVRTVQLRKDPSTTDDIMSGHAEDITNYISKLNDSN